MTEDERMAKVLLEALREGATPEALVQAQIAGLSYALGRSDLSGETLNFLRSVRDDLQLALEKLERRRDGHL